MYNNSFQCFGVLDEGENNSQVVTNDCVFLCTQVIYHYILVFIFSFH